MKHILSECLIKDKNLLIIPLLFLLFSCSSIPDSNTDSLSYNSKDDSTLSIIQKKLIEGAFWAEGRTSLKIDNKTFNVDCSGTVMAVYYYAGIDLSKDFNKYQGGGVSRIYQYLKDKKLIYYTENPVPGDILFWDNTYDANGNGTRDDILTHMGIVVDVTENETITYIHEHYRKGIIFEHMNLKDPENYDVNAAMRMRGTGMEGGWLSSHLYKESGMGYKLKE